MIVHIFLAKTFEKVLFSSCLKHINREGFFILFFLDYIWLISIVLYNSSYKEFYFKF